MSISCGTHGWPYSYESCPFCMNLQTGNSSGNYNQFYTQGTVRSYQGDTYNYQEIIKKLDLIIELLTKEKK